MIKRQALAEPDSRLPTPDSLTMEMESDDHRAGGKRLYQRLGPAPGGQADRAAGKVCFHWQAGRCNRHPCPFLHSDQDPSTSSKRTSYNNQNGNNNNNNHNLVWRNPRSGAGAGPPNQSKWGKGRHGEDTARANGGAGANRGLNLNLKPCKHFMTGTCSFGDCCRYLHSWSSGDGLSLITPLTGHQKVITAIALPSGSDKLYSASKDQTVRVWDCQTGECVNTVHIGCEVGCMISEELWLFVGIPDSIKVYNTQTGAEMNLSGPTGQIYALVAYTDMLFAAAQDGRILVWKFSAATNSFEPAAALVGHRLGVVSLVIGGPKLYSGSMDHTIKVWDLATLQCVQTLSDHTDVVMSLLCWDQFLLSCSLDNTVKIWVSNNNDQLEVTYTHNEERGVIALSGMQDAQGKPVLLCSLNDNSLHLYDLPSFSERGRVFAKQEMRAISTGPAGIFFVGDASGEMKVWKLS